MHVFRLHCRTGRPGSRRRHPTIAGDAGVTVFVTWLPGTRVAAGLAAIQPITRLGAIAELPIVTEGMIRHVCTRVGFLRRTSRLCSRRRHHTGLGPPGKTPLLTGFQAVAELRIRTGCVIGDCRVVTRVGDTTVVRARGCRRRCTRCRARIPRTRRVRRRSARGRQHGSTPSTQSPPWQVSIPRHHSSSAHTVPSATARLKHAPLTQESSVHGLWSLQSVAVVQEVTPGKTTISVGRSLTSHRILARADLGPIGADWGRRSSRSYQLGLSAQACTLAVTSITAVPIVDRGGGHPSHRVSSPCTPGSPPKLVPGSAGFAPSRPTIRQYHLQGGTTRVEIRPVSARQT